MSVTNFYVGSLRYSMNGKRRKNHCANPIKKKTVNLGARDVYTPSQREIDAHQARIAHDLKYPSYDLSKHSARMNNEDNSWKVEASKNFTIAPAYNKGAYQVIAKDMVKHIGK